MAAHGGRSMCEKRMERVSSAEQQGRSSKGGAAAEQRRRRQNCGSSSGWRRFGGGGGDVLRGDDLGTRRVYVLSEQPRRGSGACRSGSRLSHSFVCVCVWASGGGRGCGGEAEMPAEPRERMLVFAALRDRCGEGGVRYGSRLSARRVNRTREGRWGGDTARAGTVSRSRTGAVARATTEAFRLRTLPGRDGESVWRYDARSAWVTRPDAGGGAPFACVHVARARVGLARACWGKASGGGGTPPCVGDGSEGSPTRR